MRLMGFGKPLRLGHLDDEAVGTELGPVEHGRDPLRKVGFEQDQRRQVERDERIGSTDLIERNQQLDRLAQHPFAEQ